MDAVRFILGVFFLIIFMSCSSEKKDLYMWKVMLS